MNSQRSARILNKLRRGLRREYRLSMRRFAELAGNPAGIAALGHALARLTELEQALHDRQSSSPAGGEERDAALLQDWLQDQARTLACELAAAPLEERRVLANALRLVSAGEAALGAAPGEAPSGKLVMHVPTDLLFQASQALFPAERMLVAAGRREAGELRLGAVFDVTGQSSAGHVRADPAALGRALIAMSASGTHLAAWFHSHPGSGPPATCPSTTDLRQHQDWLVDYSPLLLSGIFLADRHIRFWGTAVAENRLDLRFEGTGLHKVVEDEDIYRLEY